MSENAAGAGEIPQNNEAIEDIQRQIQEDMDQSAQLQVTTFLLNLTEQRLRDAQARIQQLEEEITMNIPQNQLNQANARIQELEDQLFNDRNMFPFIHIQFKFLMAELTKLSSLLNTITSRSPRSMLLPNPQGLTRFLDLIRILEPTYQLLVFEAHRATVHFTISMGFFQMVQVVEEYSDHNDKSIKTNGVPDYSSIEQLTRMRFIKSTAQIIKNNVFANIEDLNLPPLCHGIRSHLDKLDELRHICTLIPDDPKLGQNVIDCCFQLRRSVCRAALQTTRQY